MTTPVRAAQVEDAVAAVRVTFTPDTLAARWGVSAQTIRNEITRGALPAFRVGRSYLRDAADVLEFGGLTVVK